jgi:hypothetical protein
LENSVACESELQRRISLFGLSDFDGGLQPIDFLQRGESGRGIGRVIGVAFDTLGRGFASIPAARQGEGQQPSVSTVGLMFGTGTSPGKNERNGQPYGQILSSLRDLGEFINPFTQR